MKNRLFILAMIMCLFITNLFSDKKSVQDEKKRQSAINFQNGIQHYISRDYKKASEEWLKALKMDPDNDKIMQYYDKAHSKYIESLTFYYNGKESFYKGEYDNAIGEFTSVLNINPRHKESVIFIKMCHKPKIGLKAFNSVFTSNPSNNRFLVQMDMSETVSDWVKNWEFNVMDIESKKVLKSFKGLSHPPEVLEWNIVKEGEIPNSLRKADYYMKLTSFFNRTIYSKTNTINIDFLGPLVTATAPENFSPGDTTGEKKNTVEFTVKLDDQENGVGVKEWRIDIYDEAQAFIIQTIKGDKSKKETKVEWDGTLSDGSKVVGGSTVYYQVVAVDNAENKGMTPLKPIEAEIEVRKEEKGLVIDLPNIEFDLGKAKLKMASLKILNKVGDILARYKNKKLIIEGHTDDIGDAGGNITLSKKRAESVFEYLEDEFDVDEDMVELKGYGESKPILPNTSKKNRRRNRRVEIIIKDADKEE